MNMRLLLCDDESFILHAAEFKLKRAGFEIRTANDGQQAWELLQSWKPDILVTDYQMPRLDGLGLCRKCREEEEFKDLPIIMLTAKGFELPREELIQQWKVSALIAKPFSPRELLRCVEETLEKTGWVSTAHQ